MVFSKRGEVMGIIIRKEKIDFRKIRFSRFEVVFLEISRKEKRELGNF